MKRKKVVLLGSTGSIGTSTLKVAGEIPERMEIVGLAAANSVDALAQQVAETGVKHVAIYNEEKEAELRAAVGEGVEIYTGLEGLVRLAELEGADMVLVAIVGTAGLQPALAAIEAGKELAVASKEILVMAGELVMAAAERKGVKVLPVDSEHNAIFQCLEGHAGESKEISRLILTASGGPFRTWPEEDLADVQLEQALKHPTWEMGRKITIDSATLFNKGLEMIEARWLFGVEMDKVDVIVHPQSIVHSMVEFADSSVLAQLSTTDMCFPIQYAVTYPERVPNGLKPLNFAELAKLEFEDARRDVFPAIDLAIRAGSEGGTLPAVYNAANEVAVDAFVSRDIGFTDIWKVVEQTMDAHEWNPGETLEDLIAADGEAREIAERFVQALA
ncbi:1-deoxy-D-xylulose-5-phosphate reductoisomerase [Rubritalea tangerina]|uniref:1-deoxy-D-xylulose 5-phosphate reductoisomerase n=1 Tax=Rubritalea tangerina TaxID=430798 RepID=A0ABW4ZDT0_9BACT